MVPEKPEQHERIKEGEEEKKATGVFDSTWGEDVSEDLSRVDHRSQAAEV